MDKVFTAANGLVDIFPRKQWAIATLTKPLRYCFCVLFTETAAVRLNGSNLSHMGRVEIKLQGFWHAVCSIGWDKHDADVVCRQLGFPEAVVEVGHGQFGYDSGPMWLTSVGCQGNETSLDQCVSAGWELEKDCGKRYGAGVICKMDNITGGKLSKNCFPSTLMLPPAKLSISCGASH